MTNYGSRFAPSIKYFLELVEYLHSTFFNRHSSFLDSGSASRRHNDLQLLAPEEVFQVNSDQIYAGIWDETNSRKADRWDWEHLPPWLTVPFCGVDRAKEPPAAMPGYKDVWACG